MNAACTGALYAAKRSRTHTRWKLQPLRMPKARTVRVVTPPEPQAGPPLLDADVHPITGFDKSESALSPKRGRTKSIAPPRWSKRGFLRHASGLNIACPHFTSA